MQAARSTADLDTIFSALADPTRRGFVQALADGELPISTLAATVNISLPAVSKHVTVLERAGLVVRNKRGRVTWCSLVPHAFDDASRWLDQTRSTWDSRLDRLAAMLETEETEDPTDE